MRNTIFFFFFFCFCVCAGHSGDCIPSYNKPVQLFNEELKYIVMKDVIKSCLKCKRTNMYTALNNYHQPSPSLWCLTLLPYQTFSGMVGRMFKFFNQKISLILKCNFSCFHKFSNTSEGIKSLLKTHLFALAFNTSWAKLPTFLIFLNLLWLFLLLFTAFFCFVLPSYCFQLFY